MKLAVQHVHVVKCHLTRVKKENWLIHAVTKNAIHAYSQMSNVRCVSKFFKTLLIMVSWVFGLCNLIFSQLFDMNYYDLFMKECGDERFFWEIVVKGDFFKRVGPSVGPEFIFGSFLFSLKTFPSFLWLFFHLKRLKKWFSEHLSIHPGYFSPRNYKGPTECCDAQRIGK